MSIKSLLLTGAIAATLGASGCAAVQAGAGFDEVGHLIKERTSTAIYWNQGTAADKAVADKVTALLNKELTAEAAVQVALLNNRSLQATYEELTIAQADLVAAGLLRNPVFDAEVRFPTKGSGTGFEIAIVQDFLDILYIPLRKASAEAAFEAAKLKVAGAVIDLAGQVRAALYAVQAAGQMLELRRQVAAATEASYTLAKQLRDAGNITELELANEQALFAQSKLDLRTSELELFRARERLNVLAGLWGDQTAWKLSARLPEPLAEDLDAEGLERQAIERSLELSIARQEIEQAAQVLGIARPFAMFAEAGLGMSLERETEGERTLGPVLSLPLPFFNQGQPEVAAAQATLRIAAERYRHQAVAVRSQARTTHAALVAARERAEYCAKVLLPLRQQIVHQTQLQYNAMQVGTFQLLQAKKEQIDAGSAYIVALRDYWLARTERDQLLSGRMTAFEASMNSNNEPTSAGSAPGGAGH